MDILVKFTKRTFVVVCFRSRSQVSVIFIRSSPFGHIYSVKFTTLYFSILSLGALFKMQNFSGIPLVAKFQHQNFGSKKHSTTFTTCFKTCTTGSGIFKDIKRGAVYLNWSKSTLFKYFPQESTSVWVSTSIWLSNCV